MRYRPIPTLLCATALITACDKDQSSPATAVSASATAETENAPPPQPPPRDLDLERVKKDLDCNGKQGRQACAVVADFAEAGRWKLEMPSGTGKWIGRAYTVENGQETSHLMMLRAKRVPTAKVGPTDLPFMVGWDPLPEEFTKQAEKMLGKLARDAPPKQRNLALLHLEEYEPKKEWGAVNTDGPSANLIADDAIYLRQKGRRQLFVIASKLGVSATPGDGWYASLWLATW